MADISQSNWFCHICEAFKIGEPLGTPRPIQGGLLHKMWRIETHTGTYALKVLNREIMSRPEAKVNYRNSEQIAQQACKLGLHAVPAKLLGKTPWLQLQGEYIMAFDWIEGLVLRPEHCIAAHTKKIGATLCQIHGLDITSEILDIPSVSAISEATWQRHIQTAREKFSSWGIWSQSLVQELSLWSRLYEEGWQNLPSRFVISHRDLDFKNVIWTSTNIPYLIDWESAGYINPLVELMECSVNWSRATDNSFNKKRFQGMVQGYLQAGGTLVGDTLAAIYASSGAMLHWLEYNMRRSLDSDIFEDSDRELGGREVVRTVHQLRLLHKSASTYTQWVRETLG